MLFASSAILTSVAAKIELIQMGSMAALSVWKIYQSKSKRSNKRKSI